MHRWRMPGGAIHPLARLYEGPIDVSAGDHLKTRAFDGKIWSPLDEAMFGVVPADDSNVRITEIHYNPRGANVEAGELDLDREAFEFLELQNVGPSPIDLTNVRIAEALNDGNLEGVRNSYVSEVDRRWAHIL